jgi:DNA polymerase-3 subunit alpha
VSLPDFDIDFCFERREEVIEYVSRKYGADRVGQIITFGTLKARAVIRDVARVLDVPYAEADHIAKLIPMGKKIDEALALEPELKSLYEQGDKYRGLIDIGRRLEGLNRHASTHAAGIVIGREELAHYVPLYRDPRTGSISTQYTMEFLEECGLVKMDFLGLKTLTLIHNALKLIEQKGVKLDFKQVPEDDPATFRMLGEGKSTCIFQFESSGMQGLLRRTRPARIEDLIALNALYRPGPMQWIDQFVDAKTGKTQIRYPLPELQPILKETYGVIVYQEQVMEIARRVAGFTLGQADILRRAMGKKKKDVMARMKAQFVEGARQQGYTKKVADGLFEMLVPFAEYGFPKPHAAAYSVLAYQTAYLKANHPAEFMAANLTNEIKDTDKLSEYIQESREMGLEILPPDINLSEKDFTVVDGKIVYGLQGIKNLGGQAVEEIVAERDRGGLYHDLVQFLERLDLKVLNRKVVETLILCGVFDRFGKNRATLFHNLDTLLEAVGRTKESRAFGQASLFDAFQPEELPAFERKEVEEWPLIERLRHEKENLGFFFSGHPLDRYREIIRRQSTLDLTRLDTASSDRLYTVVGLVREVREITTRTGRKMAFAAMEDLQGSVEVILFSDLYEKERERFSPSSVLAVRGKVDRSRGDPKLKAEQVLDPFQLADREPQAVHVRIAGRLSSEETLIPIRDYLIEKPGKCTVYFHLKNPGGGGEEVVIKASPQLTLAAEESVLKGLSAYPQVEEVWKE